MFGKHLVKISLLFLIFSSICYADSRTDQAGLLIGDVNGTNAGRYRSLEFTNGTTTNNSDGSITTDTSGNTTTGWTKSGTSIFNTTLTNNVGIGTTATTNELVIRHAGSSVSHYLFIGNNGADVNFYRIAKVAGGGNSYFDFTNSGVTMSGLLTTSSSNGSTQNILTVGPNPTGFHVYNTSNARSIFNAGTGNVNPPGGSLGGDVYFQGGDTANSDSGIVAGNIYLEGGYASAKSTWGNVYIQPEGTGLVGIGTANPASYIEFGNRLMNITSTGNVGIGTTTPQAGISIVGHVHSHGTAPTVANNDCGTTSQGTVSAKSTDTAGFLNVGTLTVTSCAMTFNGTYLNAPICVVSDDTHKLAIQPSTSTTKLTVTSLTNMDSDTISYICIGDE